MNRLGAPGSGMAFVPVSALLVAALIFLLVPWEPALPAPLRLSFYGKQVLCLGGARLCDCAVGLLTHVASPLALEKGVRLV